MSRRAGLGCFELVLFFKGFSLVLMFDEQLSNVFFAVLNCVLSFFA